MTPRSTKVETPRKQTLTNLATPVFNQLGYHRSTMAALAAASGISGPALYRHFTSKESLLDAVVRDGTARMEALFDETDDATGLSDGRLKHLQNRIAEIAIANPHHGAVIHRDLRNLSSEHRDELQTRWHRLVHRLGEVIAASQPTLSTWDLELLARATFAVAASPSYSRHAGVSAHQYRELLPQMMHAISDANITPQSELSPPPERRAPSAVREHASKRAAMQSAATRLFGERGFTDVSMDDIAEVVGVTDPTLYAHFEDKAALLLAAQLRGTAWLQLAVSNALTAVTSPTCRLHAVLASYAEFGVLHSDQVAVLIHGLHDLPDQELIGAGQREYVSEIISLLQICRPQLDPHDANVVTHGALAIVNELTRTRRYLGRPNLVNDLTRMMSRIVGI